MFDFRYKKHNYIYNNLVELSRNKFFYKELNLEDKLENRIILIFAHLSIILKLIKIQNKDNSLSQELYDNTFLNLENNIREMGHGDVTVNKKMKELNRIFHEILLKFVDKNEKIQPLEICKFFFKKEDVNQIDEKIKDYFEKYHYFCFDIINKNMLKDIINFKF